MTKILKNGVLGVAGTAQALAVEQLTTIDAALKRINLIVGICCGLVSLYLLLRRAFRHSKAGKEHHESLEQFEASIEKALKRDREQRGE